MKLKWITVTQKMLDDIEEKGNDIKRERKSLYGSYHFHVGLTFTYVMIQSSDAITISVILKEDEEKFLQSYEYLGTPVNHPKFRKKFSCKEFDG